MYIYIYIYINIYIYIYGCRSSTIARVVCHNNNMQIHSERIQDIDVHVPLRRTWVWAKGVSIARLSGIGASAGVCLLPWG